MFHDDGPIFPGKGRFRYCFFLMLSFLWTIVFLIWVVFGMGIVDMNAGFGIVLAGHLMDFFGFGWYRTSVRVWG